MRIEEYLERLVWIYSVEIAGYKLNLFWIYLRKMAVFRRLVPLLTNQEPFIMLDLDPKSSGLVLIDLQNGVLGRPLAPKSGSEILQAGSALAKRFRTQGAPVVLVNVMRSADGGDVLRQRVDEPKPRREGGYPAGWSDLAAGLAKPGDILITKRRWGAFYGTELDLQLRRRGVRTIVLAGVATNFGVESTARQAWEHGYEIVIAKDATTSVAKELHDMSMRYILPRLARLAYSSDISLARI
ncbi:MAG TPA: hydrolase [Burkholderiaceae bacterium]|nr:hydrolase [Burkholderiaceae bacterium]